MFISYVLRLRPDGVHQERFVAEVEAVATGQRSIVHTTDQLVGFVQQTMDGELVVSRRARGRAEDR